MLIRVQDMTVNCRKNNAFGHASETASGGEIIEIGGASVSEYVFAFFS